MSRYNENTKIGDIIKDEQAVKIINDYLPNFVNHKMINFAKMYSLKSAKAYCGMVGLSEAQADEMLKKLLELN